ncbi:hypothetical protein NUW54_g11163 [Trametes sanguinea]|uniref:Uncharacterized protein n=1 Tax=Trametes sanguinea TaxID=158606 RepID=A0ACC1NL01_9APHY|nr:hypothetical protein NUW54_g11163 [Trametes sanguinea]
MRMKYIASSPIRAKTLRRRYETYTPPIMTQTTSLQYEAPWPVYALDWCKSAAPGQSLRPRSAFRLGIASLTEDYRNRIAIVGLQDERVLVEDDYTEYPDFVTLVEAQHGYPATRSVAALDREQLRVEPEGGERGTVGDDGGCAEGLGVF